MNELVSWLPETMYVEALRVVLIVEMLLKEFAQMLGGNNLVACGQTQFPATMKVNRRI